MKKLICFLFGHKWENRSDGWQTNPAWIPEKHGFNNPWVGMTKPWKYHQCLRCDKMGDGHLKKRLLFKK